MAKKKLAENVQKLMIFATKKKSRKWSKMAKHGQTGKCSK